MTEWKNLPIDSKLFTNVQESCLSKNGAALENAFANEAGGYTRFPGLLALVPLTGNSPVYLHEWRGDLIAVSNSKVWRISNDGTAADVTGAPVSGGGRVIFTQTPDELVMAAGGEIVMLAADKTELLSPNAPRSTHVAYIEGYLLAIEVETENLLHSAPNDYRNWDPIDVFAVDSMPDKVSALMVTPYREILIGGRDSLEQFERLSTSSDIPFARRWSVGEGVSHPYTLTFADNGVWMLNGNSEFVRASGQVSRPVSDDIGNSLQGIDDYSDAWATPILIRGQKFVLLQFPNATNEYETKGITFLFDYRQNRWATLFGWNNELSSPDKWKGWSYYSIWGRHFVGGNGEVFELKTDEYQNDGMVQRVLIRTAHYDGFGVVRIENIRVRLKRGLANTNNARPVLRLRVRRDNKDWTRWRSAELGRNGESNPYVDFGGMGCASTFQLEFNMTDAAEFELAKVQAQVTGLGY